MMADEMKRYVNGNIQSWRTEQGRYCRLGRVAQLVVLLALLSPFARAADDLELSGAYPGLAVQLTDEQQQKPRGVVVVMCRVGFPAWKAGLRAGDVLIAIGRKRVESVEDVQSELQAARDAEQDEVQIQWLRQEGHRWTRGGGRIRLIPLMESIEALVQWEHDPIAGQQIGRAAPKEEDPLASSLSAIAMESDGGECAVRLQVRRVGETSLLMRRLLLEGGGNRLEIKLNGSRSQLIRLENGDERIRVRRESCDVILTSDQMEAMQRVVADCCPAMRIVGAHGSEDRKLAAEERDCLFAVLAAYEARVSEAGNERERESG